MEKSEGLTKSQVREKLYKKLMKCTKKAIVEHYLELLEEHYPNTSAEVIGKIESL